MSNEPDSKPQTPPPPLPHDAAANEEIEKLKKSAKADMQLGIICMASSVALSANSIMQGFMKDGDAPPPPPRNDAVLASLDTILLLIQILLMFLALLGFGRGAITMRKIPKDQRKISFLE